MCGRYTLTLAQDGIRAEIPTIGSFGMPWKPRYNIAPGQTVAVIASDQPTHVQGFRWGLIPSWANDPAIGQHNINARAETIVEKPSFRNAYRKRRCLLPADGFYEWRPQYRRKEPIYVRLRTRKLFTLAGLWESWQTPEHSELRTCTVVTIPANESMKRIHHRMPLIISPQTRSAWLDVSQTESETLTKLLVPYADEELEAFPVSPLVNKPQNDIPDCIKPTGVAFV